MVRGLLYVAVSFLLPGVVFAQSEPLTRTVDGITVHLGVIPAQIVQGHPKEHAESSMHESERKAGQTHIVVAVFDAKTNQRIVNAKVSARVGQIGLAPEYKDLERMQIAGTISYGNFFRMRANTRHTIRISVTPGGSGHTVEATFDYPG
jgi:hypothetical protein